MRIVTWNSEGGRLPERAAELHDLLPDLVVLQECTSPVGGVDDGSWVWFGQARGRGVGVVARNGYSVARGSMDERMTHTAFPVVVSRDGGGAPSPLHVLAICSERRPSYAGAIRDALNAYAAFLRAAPSMVIGDFNSSPVFEPATGRNSHRDLVAHLREEFGMVSAWHAHAAASDAEPPTLYHQRKESQPFHIDYCFLPEAWAPAIREVTVGGYAEWKERSDHRPVLVDVEPSAPGA